MDVGEVTSMVCWVMKPLSLSEYAEMPSTTRGCEREPEFCRITRDC